MKQKKAITLAVDALERHRRKFSVGYHAYQDEFHRGNQEGWAERDYKKYVELCEVIKEIKRMSDDN